MGAPQTHSAALAGQQRAFMAKHQLKVCAGVVMLVCPSVISVSCQLPRLSMAGSFSPSSAKSGSNLTDRDRMSTTTG